MTFLRDTFSSTRATVAVHFIGAVLAVGAHGQGIGAEIDASKPQNVTPPSASPMRLTACADLVYFSADDGLHGRELWSVDESGRCIMVSDLVIGEEGSNPESLMDVGNGRLFFSAETIELGREPYLCGVQASGPVLIGDLRPGPDASEPAPLASDGQNYYFHASTTPRNRTVFVANGGIDAPQPLWNPLSPDFLGAALLSTGELIVSSGDKLLRSDGTRPGTVDISAQTTQLLSPVDHLVSVGTTAIFRAIVAETGAELWATDGTDAGTGLVRDIWPGPADAEIGPFAVIGNEAWFQANDGIHGTELWKTDGTAEGTYLVKDIYPGTSGSDPHYFVEAGGRIYFCANDGGHGVELWVTDGTADGTQIVIDLYPGSMSGEPWSLCEFNGVCYFCANSPEFGEEIFQTDGTVEGTSLFIDIAPGSASSGPDSLTKLNNRLFFTCDDGIHGEELWSSDGTASGTALVMDIRQYSSKTGRSSRPHDLVALESRLVFAARDLVHGDELWTSDGTPERTVLLRDINPGPADSHPKELTRVNSRIVFSAETPEYGRELWCTDGTEAGTVLLKDIWQGVGGGTPRSFSVLDNDIYFVADCDNGQAAIWRSKGIAETTVLLEENDPPVFYGKIEYPFELRGRMYFYATETPDESSLWKIQSNDALIRILRFPRSKIVHPVFPTDAPSTGIDGDPPALLLSVVRPFCDHPDTQRVLSFGSRTFFPAYRMDTGSELWMTDGTTAGTRLFVDCFPGPASSSPVLLASRETRFLFVADHARYGRVLWTSDGTAEGTHVLLPVDRSGHAGSPLVASEAMYVENRVLVAGFYSDSSLRVRRFIALQDDSGNVVPNLTEPMELTEVHSLTAVKNQVFFVADDGIRGEELWKLDSVAESTTLVRDILP